MINISQAEKAVRGAGIHALSWKESNVSPHSIIIRKEREFFSKIVKDSLTGLQDLADKSAGVVSAFENLQSVVKEARLFFLNGNTAATEDLDRIFALRIASYEIGRTTGFEKVIRLVRRKLLPVETIGGASFQKEEFEAALAESLAFEQRRVAGVHRISTALNDCVTRLSRDKNLQLALCTLSKCDDVETFVRTRREEAQTSTRNLFEWLQQATTVHAAFCPEFIFEGWFAKFHKLGSLLEFTPDTDFQLSKPIGTMISAQRRATIASSVVKALDEVAYLARHYNEFPESPTKDIYRIHFLLGELEKALPTEVADAHRKQLSLVTSRFIQHPEGLVHTIGVEQDLRFSEQERTQFLDHIKRSLDSIDEPPADTPYTPSIPDLKRSEIRRERREEIQLEREAEAEQALRERILEIKEASQPPRTKSHNALTFFPPRLEQEFLTWTETFPEHVRNSVKGLLETAARGERVDSKVINIEKKIFELRLLGCGYRIYCTRSKNNDLVVLGFGAKESQKQDILTAHGRFRHFCANSETT